MLIDLRSWKLWITIAIVIIIVIFILSLISTWKNGNRHNSQEFYDTESICYKRPKKNRKKKYRRYSNPDESIDYVKTSTRLPDPRIFKTPAPMKVSKYAKDDYLSSRDAIPSLEIVTSSVPQPMKELDLTPPVPSFLTIPRANNDDGVKSQSKGEGDARAAMEKVYGVPFNKERPAWLVNPKTGRRLELDGVNHDLKMAFEYHGEQHYIFKPYFYATYEEFAKQVERDNVKVDLCDANGYYLITIPYNITKEQMVDYIRYNDPSAVALRNARQAEIYGR